MTKTAMNYSDWQNHCPDLPGSARILLNFIISHLLNLSLYCASNQVALVVLITFDIHGEINYWYAKIPSK